MKKIILFIMVLASLISLSSCFIDEWADNIGDDIVNNYIKEFDTENNSPNPTGDGLIEELLYENVLIDELLEEDTIYEEIINEQIIHEIEYDEFLSKEDIKLEAVKTEFYDNVDELQDDFLCESYHTVELDYAFIKQRISEGMSILLTEVIIDCAGIIIDICTLNWGELLLDAGQILVMAGGATLTAYIRAQIALSKSLKAGNSYEMAMYDALYEGANAFYYTVTSIDYAFQIINTVQMIENAAKALSKVYKKISSLSKSVDVIGNDGKIIGRVTSRGFEIKLDGKKINCKPALGQSLDGNEIIDLYDEGQKYVTSLRWDNDYVSTVKKNIPSEILYKNNINAGKVKYKFEGNKMYYFNYKQDGSFTKTFGGIIDAGGFVRNNFNQIIKRIDLNTGKEIDGFFKITKLPSKNKITVNVFGELVEITDVQKNITNPLKKVNVDGKISYFDSENVKLITEYDGSDGVKYIKGQPVNGDNGKVCGSIYDNKFDFSWKSNLDYVRSNATRKIRESLVDFTSTNDLKTIKKYFPQLKDEAIDYIKSYRRVPSNIDIHHVKNVANFPDKAGDYTNLVVVPRDEHLLLHNNDFHNMSTAKPDYYVDLKYLFNL